MQACWCQRADERPTFEGIFTQIIELLKIEDPSFVAELEKEEREELRYSMLNSQLPTANDSNHKRKVTITYGIPQRVDSEIDPSDTSIHTSNDDPYQNQNYNT